MGLALLAGIDVEAELKSPRGRHWRREIGKWIGRLVPVEILVPDSAERWRPLVRDAFRFTFERLSDRRLATKVSQQFEMSAGTAPEQRLLRLVNKMPGLQKVGQVLARNRRLAPKLRSALSELENGMSDVTVEEIRGLIEERLGKRLSGIRRGTGAGDSLRSQRQRGDPLHLELRRAGTGAGCVQGAQAVRSGMLR